MVENIYTIFDIGEYQVNSLTTETIRRYQEISIEIECLDEIDQNPVWDPNLVEGLMATKRIFTSPVCEIGGRVFACM
jgi:hypothetical protein